MSPDSNSTMAIEYRNIFPDKQAFFDLFLTTGWNREYGLTAD